MASYKIVKSVKKAMAILEYLSAQREPMTGIDVAKGVDLPGGTVMGLLATLQEDGYVQIVGDQYKLGMKLAVFWSRAKAEKQEDRSRIDKELALLSAGGL